jgi:hypothetical protein
MLIHNKARSHRRIAYNTRSEKESEFARAMPEKEILLAPGQTTEVPDALMKQFMARPIIKAWFDCGDLYVAEKPAAPQPQPKFMAAVEVPAPPMPAPAAVSVPEVVPEQDAPKRGAFGRISKK